MGVLTPCTCSRHGVVAGPPVETAAGLKGVPPEDTLQDRLATCQQNFISKLLAEGRAAKVSSALGMHV